MKKKYLFLIPLFVFLMYCSDDGDNESTSTISLTGKWKIEKYSDPSYYKPCDYLGWINIKEGGSYSEYDECDKSIVGGSWSKSGDNLTIISDELSIPFTFKIISLSGTTLILRSTVLGETEDVTYEKIKI